MTNSPLLLIAEYDSEKMIAVKALLFVLVACGTTFGMILLRRALGVRHDLQGFAIGACAGSGVLVITLGIARILFVWYDSFPGVESLDLLTNGILLLLAAAVLDRWWALPSPPSMPPPPVPPPAA